MTVGEARALALRWVTEALPRLPDFVGAYTAGSVNCLPDEVVLPAASDFDVMADRVRQRREHAEANTLGFAGAVATWDVLHERHLPGFWRLLNDLGVSSHDDLKLRAEQVKALLPGVRMAADAIMAATPGIV